MSLLGLIWAKAFSWNVPPKQRIKSYTSDVRLWLTRIFSYRYAPYRLQSLTDKEVHGVSFVRSTHYNDVMMGAIAFQISSLTIVHSTVYSGADQRRHRSSMSLAFVCGNHRGRVNSPHKWSVTRKMFPFDDVIMSATWSYIKPTILQYSVACLRPLCRRQATSNFGVDNASLQWRHNERNSVINLQPLHCLLNSWFIRRSKKTSKLTGECPTQRPVMRKIFPFDDVNR